MKRFSVSWLQLRRPALALAILIAFACGPQPFDLNEFISYFQPEAATVRPDDQPYFFSPQVYYEPNYGYGNYDENPDSLIVDDNMRAWQTYAGGAVPMKAIHAALYGDDRDNAFTARLAAAKPGAMAYLRLAWEADKAEQTANAMAINDGSDPQSADSTQNAANTTTPSHYPAIQQQAQAGYRQTTDPFLKERYAFQLVKLAMLDAQPEQAIQQYDKLVKSLKTKTFISDWALCRRAGASFALGDTARAIFDFAQVFDRCPSRRDAAEKSLRIYNLKFQEAALSPAQTDRERAAVYALCAIQPGQDALDYLKKMVELQPDNALNELVMAREINRNEYYFLNEVRPVETYDVQTKNDSVRVAAKLAQGSSYFDKLRTFAGEAAGNDKLTNKAFWITALAYLDFLGKDYKAAQTHLDEAEKASAINKNSNPALPRQIALQRMLLLSAQTDKITPEVETQLIRFLEQFGGTQPETSESFRLNNAFVRVCREFAAKYAGTSDEKAGGLLSSCQRKGGTVDAVGPVKAWLLTMLTGYQHNKDQVNFNSSADQYAIEDTTSAATVQRLIAYAHQPSATDFDKRLLKLSGFDDAYFNLLLGRRSMAEHRYAQAADAFGKVDPKTWQTEPFQTWFVKNPFGVKMPGEAAANSFTPLTFAQKMAALETEAKAATGDQAAELYYQLGCGAFNLSWYGNAWLLVKRGWSSGETALYDLPTDPARQKARIQAFLADPYYNTNPARAFFAQSLKAAQNPDLADRAAYLIARCEANAFETRRAAEQALAGSSLYSDDNAQKTFDRKMEALREKDYHTAFADLFNNHASGHFHDRMIRECPFYADFLNPGADDESGKP